MKYFLTAFIIMFSLSQGTSCSCGGPKEFCTIMADSSWINHGYVLMGKKLDDIEHGMEVEVIKSYRKEFESEKIRVWGDLGWLCREYTGGFTVGDTFVFNLIPIGENSVSPIEREQDFSLSFCGRHYLHVKDGQVIGHFDDRDSLQYSSIPNFDRYMSGGDCSVLSLIETPLVANLGPNPFVDNMHITAETSISEILLYDISGKLIFRKEVSGQNHFIEMSHLNLTPGCYVLRLVANRFEDKVLKVIKA